MMKYFENMLPILQNAIDSQHEKLMILAEWVANAVERDQLIYVFGAGHAGILAEELCYRAGGLVPVVPIFPAGLTVQSRPITLETEMERITGLGTMIVDQYRLEPDGILILHSNSGRNAVTIEMGERARELGMKVVAVTNEKQCRKASSRHPRGLKLIDVADLIIDNCGISGDACVPLGETRIFAGSTSTVVAVALLNAVMVEAAEQLVMKGINPPVFHSANVDGNENANEFWLSHYGKRLHYL